MQNNPTAHHKQIPNNINQGLKPYSLFPRFRNKSLAYLIIFDHEIPPPQTCRLKFFISPAPHVIPESVQEADALRNSYLDSLSVVSH